MRIPAHGMRLNVERAGSGPPLVLLHGFTGAAVTWGSPPALSRRFATLAIDLPGHGASDAPPDPDRYGLPQAAADALAVLDALDVGRFGLAGYSLGGRLALHMALAAPERLAALVLEGAAPGLADADERCARRAADAGLAQLLLREGLTAFVDRWERQPIFASQARVPERRRAGLRSQRLAGDAAGLAASLRGMGLGTQQPLLPRLTGLAVPTLLVVGGRDAKFRALAAEMAAALPHAELAVVARSGHAAHFERPRVFTRLVEGFLLRYCEDEGGQRRWR